MGGEALRRNGLMTECKIKSGLGDLHVGVSVFLVSLCLRESRLVIHEVGDSAETTSIGFQCRLIGDVGRPGVGKRLDAVIDARFKIVIGLHHLL